MTGPGVRRNYKGDERRVVDRVGEKIGGKRNGFRSIIGDIRRG